MSNNIDLILRIKSEGDQVFLQVGDQISKLGDAAARTDAKLKSSSTGAKTFADNVDRMGSRARVGLGAIAQLGDAAGLELSSVIGPAQNAADAVGDLAGSFGKLGAAGFALGGVIGLMALLIAKSREQNAVLVESVKAHDAYLGSLKKVGEVNKEVAASIDRVAQAQTNLAQAQNRIFGAGSANVYAAKLAQEAYDREKAALDALVRSITPTTDAMLRLRDAEAIAASMFAATTAAIQAQTLALDYQAAAALRVTAAMGDTRKEAIEGRREDARAYAQYKTNSQWGDKIYVSGLGWVPKDYNKQLAAFNAAQQRIRDALKGMVETSLTPTAVTDEDNRRSDILKQIAKLESQREGAGPGKTNQINSEIDALKREQDQLGAYTDKWDEWRRRAEAVASGTDVSAFGDKFREQLDLVKGLFSNLTLPDITKKFADFSLFADAGKFQQLLKAGVIDMGPIIDSVNSQIDQIIGKANAMQEAFDQAWASLSSQKKIDLAKALGIETGGIQNVDTVKADIENKIADPAGAAAGEVGKIGSAINAIPKSVTTVFNVVKHALFDSTYAAIKEAIAKIPTSIEIAVGLRNGLPAPNGTPPPPGPPPPRPSLGYARGGEFTVPPGFPNDTYPFRVTSGEVVTITPPSEVRKSSIGEFITRADTPAKKVKEMATASRRAEGGDIGKGIYEVGERGTEYMLPHELTAWLESVLGGTIQSPNQIKWLVESLGRGSLLTDAPNWATQMGANANLPSDAKYWASHIKVKTGVNDGVKGEAIQKYGSWLSALGGTPATGDSSDGTSGASSGGSGGGGESFADPEMLNVLRESMVYLKSINSAIQKIANANGVGTGNAREGNAKDSMRTANRLLARDAMLLSALGQ